MPRNQKLLDLSRDVIEDYVGLYLKNNRDNVKTYRQSTFNEDTEQKIDLIIETYNGKNCPIQVKTRERDSNNFSISSKDIIESQENRVFAFIDKTFSNDVVEQLNSLPVNEAKALLESESPKVYICPQQRLINSIKNGDCKNMKTYFLVPKKILTMVEKRES